MDSSTSDRLTELPDALIIEILSLLPMKDVVGTMLLSKRWLHLWTTVPRLKFKRESKYKFVSGVLERWKGSKILKLSLTFNSRNRDIAAMVDCWLLRAMENQAEELRLRNRSHRNKYCPPQHLYSCSSVTKMSLSFCKLRIDEVVQWNRLKFLKIEGADWLGEDNMNRILAGAPLLEKLFLAYHDHSRANLNIRSSSLKILGLSIRDFDDDFLSARVLRVWAPNLLDLEIHGYCYGTCLLDVPSLAYANIYFNETSYPVQMLHQLFQSIRHVEKLELSEFNIKTLLCMKHRFEFPKAKFLSLDIGRAEEILGVLHMFPNLTTLRVQNDWDAEEIGSHLSKADLASPSVRFLKIVDITWYMRDISIIPVLKILLENAKLLDKMVFMANWCRWDGDRPELLSKSASSPTAEVTIIHLN